MINGLRYRRVAQLASLSHASPEADELAFKRSMALAVPALYKALESHLDSPDDQGDDTQNVCCPRSLDRSCL